MSGKTLRPWLTVAAADELFRYEEETGFLIWRRDKGRAREGQIAGSLDNKGYVVVMVDRRNYKAHRIIWALKTGEWPTRQIDHRDTDKQNNRWDNLRSANNQQNHANRGKNTNNTSGFKDVIFDARCPMRPWLAKIMVDGKAQYCGYFSTASEAAGAAASAHRRAFGEFSRS